MEEERAEVLAEREKESSKSRKYRNIGNVGNH
jgi:hypothetical protein